MGNGEPNRVRVNAELKRLGFGGLEDSNLMQQLAFFVRSHDQFRGLIMSTIPEQRYNCYQALRPHLRFTPKPLDVYIAEGKLRAEQQQLPSYNPRTGELIPMKVGEVNIDLLASEAIAQNRHEKAGGHLEMVCARCTYQEFFTTKTAKDARKLAHQSGWRSDGQKAWCPQHIPARATMHLDCQDCDIHIKLRVWDATDGYAKARLQGWVINEAAHCPSCSAKAVVIQ